MGQVIVAGHGHPELLALGLFGHGLTHLANGRRHGQSKRQVQIGRRIGVYRQERPGDALQQGLNQQRSYGRFSGTAFSSQGNRLRHRHQLLYR
jgi:hypothetical protein